MNSTTRRLTGTLATVACLATLAGTANAAPVAHREAPRPSHASTHRATPDRDGRPQVRRTAMTKATSTTKTTSSVTSATTLATSTSSSAVSYAATASIDTAGLSANAIKVVKAVNKNFPQFTSIGGIRSDANAQDHASGHAVDLMTSNEATGDAIAAYMVAHADQLGIKYVIWRQHIWSVQRSSEGWRAMADRGSATANHYDHVHVSVN